MAEPLDPAVEAELQAAPLSYAEVGGTTGRLPAGYHHQQLSAPVGYGPAQLDAAAACLLGWQMHAGAGLRPQVSDAVAAAGSVAVLRLQLGPVRLRVPVRVVRVVEEPGRRGFAYGTLPGHPERGEESFVVELAADGTVFFHLRAFSRPARWFTRLGGPVSRKGQAMIAERYLKTVWQAAQAGGAVPAR
jgi:uncharacterized protein (UPF0548 family)